MGYQLSRAAGWPNLPNGYFVPEIWSMKMKARFYETTNIEAWCNTDWQGEIEGKGATVHIRHELNVEVNDYVDGQTTTSTPLTDEETQLLIDKGKYWQFDVSSVEMKQADVNFTNSATKSAAKNNANAIEQQILQTVYSEATSSLSSTVVTATNVCEWISDAEVKLDELNVPSEGRWILLPPWIIGKIKNSDLAGADFSGDKMSLMRSRGGVGTIFGFTVYKTNNIYLNSSTYCCLAGHPSFCSFANQFTETHLDMPLESQFGSRFKGLNVYGFKVVYPESGVYMPATKS